MTNSRYGRGLILAITTPKSLKVKDKEIYYVQSEKNTRIRYRVNFEDGTCTCGDFKNRGEICKHFYKVVMERALC
jgi:SWIM zinc finger